MHGDAQQEAIKKYDLKPLIDAARRIVDRDSSGKLKDVLARFHAGLQDYALGVKSDLASGQRVPKWTARGAEQVAKVMIETDPVSCACVVASVFMLREQQPYRFASQRGFEFELVRAFRKQIDTSWGKYWNDKKSISKSVYKELTPRCVEAIATLLTYTYVPVATKIITLYQKERVQPIKDKQTLDEVFVALSLTRRVDPAETEGDEPQGWSKVRSSQETG